MLGKNNSNDLSLRCSTLVAVIVMVLLKCRRVGSGKQWCLIGNECFLETMMGVLGSTRRKWLPLSAVDTTSSPRLLCRFRRILSNSVNVKLVRKSCLRNLLRTISLILSSLGLCRTTCASMFLAIILRWAPGLM